MVSNQEGAIHFIPKDVHHVLLVTATPLHTVLSIGKILRLLARHLFKRILVSELSIFGILCISDPDIVHVVNREIFVVLLMVLVVKTLLIV